MPLSGDGAIWLVGAGNMGGAMLRRWLSSGLDPARVTVIRRSGAPAGDGVLVLTAPPMDGPPPTLVMLGVKPQMLDVVAPSLAGVLGPDTLLLSILAGVEIASLRQRFPAPRAILRAMPNTPVALGQGVVALAGDGLDPAQRAMADELMAPLGLVEWIDEDAMDAVAALAGSGPAFLFRFIDALTEAGMDAGLPGEQSARLALATVAGAGALAASSEDSPRILADKVASPGGSTRFGLDVLDAPEALVPLLGNTLAAAIRRNRELAALAR